MSEETGYITSSEGISSSASDWCESGSDTEWEDQQGPALGRKSNLKAPPLFPAAPRAVPAPSLVPSIAPSAPSFQFQVPNDQDKYPDLPDYMPYMPLCVPHTSSDPLSSPAHPDQPAHFTVNQMSGCTEQQNGRHQTLLPNSSNPFLEVQGAGEHDNTTGRSIQGAGMSLQQGIKSEYQSGTDDLLLTYPGTGLWFDASIGQFRSQPYPQAFEDNGFSFEFDVPVPFALSGAELAMDPIPFAPSGDREPPVDTELYSSKSKASTNANANAIPLVCFLCEKVPKFSDVSHLLTHISSKGHLSRRFHLDLKAQTDNGAQQRLLQFDIWFEQYGIQKLLKARQEAKDQKKQVQGKRQKGNGNEKKPRRASCTREGLKGEFDDGLQLPVSHLNPLNQQSWHQGVPLDNSYQTPSNKGSRSIYPVPDSPQDLSYQVDEPVETGNQGGSRTPTLKGVIHKGMGIFDAGTPEMKRMRNQRKHPSVLNNMVLVSESISMTEQVWNETMTRVEHERNVYDTPTDLSSPASKDDDEPLPKKLRGTHAVPRPTGPASKRLTRSSTRPTNGASTRASRGGKRGGGKRGGVKRGGGKKIAKIEDQDFDSDEELNTRRGKRSLGVFHDVAEDDGPLGDVFGGRPQGVQNFGVSSFGGQQADFPNRTAMQGLPSNRPISSIYERPDNHQFVMYDKENDRNAFSMQQTSSIHGYYQPRHNIQSGAFNPLFVQRQDNFANVFGQGFDAFKPSSSAFQPINGMGYGGTHGGISTSLQNGLNNGLNDDLQNGFNSDISHALNNGLSNSGLSNGLNNGSHFQPGNNGGQNNGFDIE